MKINIILFHLNENYLMMVRYLNPIIEELYPDKFKILDNE